MNFLLGCFLCVSFSSACIRLVRLKLLPWLRDKMVEFSFRRTYREATYKVNKKKAKLSSDKLKNDIVDTYGLFQDIKTMNSSAGQKSGQSTVPQFGPQLENHYFSEVEANTLSKKFHRTKYQFSRRLLHIQLRLKMCSPQNCNKCMKMIHLVSSPIKAVRTFYLEFNIFRSFNRYFRWAAGIWSLFFLFRDDCAKWYLRWRIVATLFSLNIRLFKGHLILVTF